jgi:hypothetical protein
MDALLQYYYEVMIEPAQIYVLRVLANLGFSSECIFAVGPGF